MANPNRLTEKLDDKGNALNERNFYEFLFADKIAVRHGSYLCRNVCEDNWTILKEKRLEIHIVYR